MNKLMITLIGCLLLSCFGGGLVTTKGSKCEPKWYRNKEKSTKEVVYGYSWEKSRNSSIASQIGLAQAQSLALSQINQFIDNDLDAAFESVERNTGREVTDDFRSATLGELHVNVHENCSHCVIENSEDCIDDGYVVVYTMVKIDVQDYLDKEYQDKKEKLLEKPELLLQQLKDNK